MTEPLMPKKSPYLVMLEPGTYYWCSCGRSKNQPFCDGSHQGTEFTPVEFQLPLREMVYLCGCKRTKHPPFCDSTHFTL